MRDRVGRRYYLRPLWDEDVSEVGNIDQEAFSTLWSPNAFLREVKSRSSQYLVVVQDRRLGNVSSAIHVPRNRPPSFVRWMRKLTRIIWSDRKDADASKLVVGFIGVMFVDDEAHVTSIAVRSQYRSLGLGEFLLVGAIELALQKKVRVVTLETRVSNSVAKALYEKYGFNVVGVRKAYYRDNNEDAFIMSTEVITASKYRDQFQRMMEQFRERRGEPTWVFS